MNTTDRPRVGLTTNFCAPQFRQQENLQLGTLPEVLENASQELLDGDAAAAVPDAMVDTLHLVGAADRIKDRLARGRAAARAGHVTGIIVTTEQPEALELLAAELL